MTDLGLTSITRVALSVSWRGLQIPGREHDPDTWVEVLERIGEAAIWTSHGTSEVQCNEINPVYETKFYMDYHFQETEYLLFKIIEPSETPEGRKTYNIIYEMPCTLGEIVGAPGQTITRLFENQYDHQVSGQIILSVEEFNETKEKMVATCMGNNIEDVGNIFRKMRPIFNFIRVNGPNDRTTVYTSEFCFGRNPSWHRFDINMQTLCNNDYYCKIVVEVYDYRKNGNHKYIGEGTFTIHDVINLHRKNIKLKNPVKNKKKDYLDSGSFQFRQIDIQREHSFIDYIRCGCQISLICAIDFSASNGNPHHKQSLHYLNHDGLNDYEKALKSVAEILLNYDDDKLVPMYGFGAKVNGRLSHCFHLNGNDDDPEVAGLDGIMSSYREALLNIELSGPTRFAPVLEKAVQAAREAVVDQFQQQYFILMILTDGEICDMRKTIDLIVAGSDTPLSIVIIGLGNDKFEEMNILDADDIALYDSQQRKMKRDIVQFVPYRDVGQGTSKLARQVLDEVPREIVNYFTSRRIFPNPDGPILSSDQPLTMTEGQEPHSNYKRVSGVDVPQTSEQSILSKADLTPSPSSSSDSEDIIEAMVAHIPAKKEVPTGLEYSPVYEDTPEVPRSAEKSAEGAPLVPDSAERSVAWASLVPHSAEKSAEDVPVVVSSPEKSAERSIPRDDEQVSAQQLIEQSDEAQSRSGPQSSRRSNEDSAY